MENLVWAEEPTVRKRKKECKVDKEVYYNCHDFNGEDRVTVCLVKSGDNVARGVTACSYDDEVNEGIGKDYAKHYALRALKGRDVGAITDRRAIKILISTWCPHTKNGELNPDLSWYEKKLLFGWKRMHDYVPDTNPKCSYPITCGINQLKVDCCGGQYEGV